MDIFIYIITGMCTSFVLCIGMLLFYFKYRRNILQQQFRIKENEVLHQKNLLQTTITSQEKERYRIGMDLHDVIGTSLSSLKLLADNPGRNVELKERIDEITTRVRSISHDLSPRISGEYGFIDALAEFCDTVNRTGAIYITLTWKEKKAETFLRGENAIALYRVLSELINNTLKHARATQVDITFSCSDTGYLVEYADNGVGITATKEMKGIGFRNIESRLSVIGAAYEIPKEMNGFQMKITLPDDTETFNG